MLTLDMGVLAAISARRLSGNVSDAILRAMLPIGAMLAFGAYLFLATKAHYVIGPSAVGFGCAMMPFANQSRQRKRVGRRF
jgi:hypothetical protein